MAEEPTMIATAPTPPAAEYLAALERLRRAAPLPLDLAGWSPAEAALPGVPPPERDPGAAARAAVARYLESHGAPLAPEQVVTFGSFGAAHAAALAALVPRGDALLAPAGAFPAGDAAWPEGIEVVPYRHRYDGAWHLDLKGLRRALSPRVRALVLASPAHPSGAVPDAADLEAVESLCADHGLTLVVDERLLDAASDAVPSLARGRRVTTVHLSGLATVAGLAEGPGWAAVAGPAAAAGALAAALRRTAPAEGLAWAAAQARLPAALDGRGAFLGPLRHRLTGNRAHLEVAALREAPWSVLESGGGWAAVLQIGAAWRAGAVALRLLAEGVVVRPGALDGLPGDDLLVLSLLTEPVAFDRGLERLERLLRGGDAP
jgi:aspartate/methionine/tyrosine aminotransferase